MSVCVYVRVSVCLRARALALEDVCFDRVLDLCLVMSYVLSF